MAVDYKLAQALYLYNFYIQERRSDGRWRKHTQLLEPGKKYRFRIKLRSRASGASMPPFNQPHSHYNIYGIRITRAPSSYRFYRTSDYTGQSSNRGTVDRTELNHNGRIYRNKTRTFYIYFKVKTRIPPLPAQVGVSYQEAFGRDHVSAFLPPID